MKQGNEFEGVNARLPGDRALRIHRRRPHRKMRVSPNIPAFVRFLRDIAARTPLIPLIIILVGMWFLASLGIYLAEHAVNEQINSYGYALWWSLTAMQTQGANAPGPITSSGIIIGSVWSVFSTIAFFGVIIGSLYAYFMYPRRRPSREMIEAIQYNLSELENLSIDELRTLRETTVRVINTQIKQVRETSSD